MSALLPGPGPALADLARDSSPPPPYRLALVTLEDAAVPFLVGGAFALSAYTGVHRDTKDLDLFLKQVDMERALAALGAAGFHTELRSPIWLGKASWGAQVVDLIFSSGNGVAAVDDSWFRHALPAVVLGTPVQLCAPEEMLWSKAYVMERERFDGADVAHLLRACCRQMDWPRLLHRFSGHWEVLLSHLVLFGFVYPDDRHGVPAWLWEELLRRLRELPRETGAPRKCRGALLSRCQYRVDLEHWGYQDAAEAPHEGMLEPVPGVPRSP